MQMALKTLKLKTKTKNIEQSQQYYDYHMKTNLQCSSTQLEFSISISILFRKLQLFKNCSKNIKFVVCETSPKYSNNFILSLTNIYIEFLSP